MWATQAPRRSPPPWAEAPCHGSTASFCATPALATRAWWALRRLPALTFIYLEDNPFGDEGIAALVAPPPPVGALPPPVGALPPSKGVLTKLTDLYLGRTQITDAGCAALAPLRSTATHCRLSRGSICTVALPAPRRNARCM